MWVLLNIGFHGEALLASRPTPNLEDHPSSAVRDCLFNLFAATLHIGGRSSIRNLRTRHAVGQTQLQYVIGSFIAFSTATMVTRTRLYVMFNTYIDCLVNRTARFLQFILSKQKCLEDITMASCPCCFKNQYSMRISE